ncbi:MAG: pyridoxamine 5'-phosphate oxidase family protein [Phycisphaeraceae bacterium]|nr:pyridoxamine 5'-phosphate oxidase family protein [Phycisphaeraceae bacterium]
MANRNTLTDRDRVFITKQRMFFVATAPLSGEGLINLSPKGLDGTFAIIDKRTVAYLDLTGSGIETLAHLRENGRICIMFNAYEGPPNILRIQGRGEAIEPGQPGFDELAEYFPDLPGVRSIIKVTADRIADSCGFGVPFYEYKGQRDTLTDWAEKKGPEGVTKYQEQKNLKSLDGLAGLESPNR